MITKPNTSNIEDTSLSVTSERSCPSRLAAGMEDNDDDASTFAKSTVSAPDRLDQPNEGIQGLDSHEYPPFAAAVPVVTDEKHFPAPVHSVEVDTTTGTIRVETQDGQSGMIENPHERPNTQISRYHQCWLIVFIRRCARKAKDRSRIAAKKYTPKVRKAAKKTSDAVKKYNRKAHQVAKDSMVAAKGASERSATFVRTQSVQLKSRAVEFNEKHQVRAKARDSFKVMKQSFKKATKATVKEVKKASINTTKSVKDFEAKHRILAKSQKGLSQSTGMIRNAWNGKPLQTGLSSHAAAAVEERTTPAVATATVVEEPIDRKDSAALKTPPPSSE